MDFFGVGPVELLLILLVTLIVVGPRRLPAASLVPIELVLRLRQSPLARAEFALERGGFAPQVLASAEVSQHEAPTVPREETGRQFLGGSCSQRFQLLVCSKGAVELTHL